MLSIRWGLPRGTAELSGALIQRTTSEASKTMYYIGLDVLRAIALAKKKNDRIDAGKIADCLRCDFLPECHMAPTAIRDRRRVLRYRNLVIKQSVQMKNRVSGLLMETGVSYNKQRLHKVGYFRDLLSHNEEVSDSIRPLLKICREQIERSQKLDYALVSRLERDPLLKDRLERLRTVPGVGPITALTWALEIGDVARFTSIKEAISYCGLCGEEKSSADKVMRTPLPNNATSTFREYWSKPRNWRP